MEMKMPSEHGTAGVLTINLLTDGLSRLDTLPAAELLSATKAELGKSNGRFPAILAERLDQLFAVKCVRALRSTRAPVSDLRELDDLIARVGRERYAEELDSDSRRFYARWKALRGMLSIALSIEEREEQKDKARPVAEADVWAVVAELVLREAAHGIPWSDIKSELEEKGVGPSSKTGFSNLISAMRNAGWLETVSEGRRKRVFPGSRIYSSSVYDAVLNPPHAASGRSSTATRADADAAEFLREVVCLNQGKLIEYDRITSQKCAALSHHIAHAQVRIQAKLPAEESSFRRRQRARSLVDDLDGFLHGTFGAVAQKNFSLLRDYFSSRSETPPRICIKGNWKSHGSLDQSVSTVIRDNDVNYESTTTLDGNSAFARISESGKWCLFNDVPKAAFKGVYTNPRLNAAAIQHLRESEDSKKLEEGTALDHRQWSTCWKDFRADADPRDFYRSTLVIPMTLRNNNVSHAFAETFGAGGANAVGESVDRTVIGFLCLDHVDRNFFNMDFDIAVGYVLADLLSVYLFKWVSVTRFSEDYVAVKTFSAQRVDEQAMVEVEKVRIYFDKEISTPAESLDLKPTFRNALIQLNETLTARHRLSPLNETLTATRRPALKMQAVAGE